MRQDARRRRTVNALVAVSCGLAGLVGLVGLVGCSPGPLPYVDVATVQAALAALTPTSVTTYRLDTSG